ncbi:hypothetical protein, partial [Nostoc sp.]|uniref:hypothetical protein n=1 Tax=Nostoc sp. TaxID=1180 RepID=UPI002FFCDDCE
ILTNGLVIFSKDNFYSSFLLSHVIYIKDESIAIQAITGIPPQELYPHPETGNVMWRQTVQVSEELGAILDKMVCYHFSDRYQSATAVLQDLKRFSTK